MVFNIDFTGKAAISTGAASGMGLLFAQCFAESGGNVLMCDVNEEVLQEKVNEINQKGNGRAVGIVCDVRDYAQVCAARDRAVAEFGRIDVVCNFAGGTAVRVCKAKATYFPDVPIEIYDWGLDVNMRAQLYFGHAVMKQMCAQESGIIVNIGSITGAEADGLGVEYATAKSGVMHGLTKALAQCGAPHNVRCVCVSPGPVLTRPQMANMKTMLGRAADPQEIIDLVMYVISDYGAFINATNIMIDGGREGMQRIG
ncbi:MAG: SDR family oxidoreductase [Ruminococcaceae bacterium]|nr:SDR family oxidoreductase [Oscillospiraceae bacterium]